MVEIRAKRVLAALAAVLAVSGAQQEHAAAAYAADDARRQRHQRQRRVLILAAGSIQKRRKIRRNDGGWASSTINSYLLHGDARTYKHVRGGCGHSRSTRRASKLAVGVLSWREPRPLQRSRVQWRARGFQGLKVVAFAHSEQGCALVRLCLSMCEVGVRAGGVCG